MALAWMPALCCSRSVRFPDVLWALFGAYREGAEARDGVIERNVDLHRPRDQLLDVLKLLEPVLGEHVLAVGDHHAGHEAAERGDAVALADAQDRRVDVGGAGLERAVGVGDGAAGVVVEVRLDVAADDAAQRAHQLVDLARPRAAHGVGDADPVHADLVDGRVDGQQVDQVRAERVLAREAHLDAARLDELDDLNGRVLDVRHVLAVAVLAQVRRGADDHVDAVDARLDRHPRVVHVAADVRQDLGLEAQLADGLAVEPALLGRGGTGQFDLPVMSDSPSPRVR